MRPLALTAATVALALPATASPAAAPTPERAAGGVGFELRRTAVKPKRPLFDGRRPPRLRYRFDADRRVDLRISVVAVRSGRTVAVWRERDARPGRRLERSWNGVDRRGRPARDGRYDFRVGPRGRGDRHAGRFTLRGHVFPVDGPHGDRGAVGEFGAGRSDGRTHEGFDTLADCGTPLVAARGGRVRRVGYDPRLYGHFLLINARKSDERYFYSHLISKPPLGDGDRVRTGDRVGRVGQTGNAASTSCQLHFELRRSGRLIDPEPELRRWDRWS